jgi:hypothetical protein
MTIEPKFGHCKDCAAWGWPTGPYSGRERFNGDKVCCRMPHFEWTAGGFGCFSFIEKKENEK